MRIDKAMNMARGMEKLSKRARRRLRAQGVLATAKVVQNAGFHVFPFSPTLWVAVGPDFFAYRGPAYFCGNASTPIQAIQCLLGHRDAYPTWKIGYGVKTQPKASDFKMHKKRLEPTAQPTPAVME